jgi:hypothetical protein
VRENLVQQAVRELAQLGCEPVDRAEVVRTARENLPGQRRWSWSLMLRLVGEGVLTELDDHRTAFGYQPLGP